MDKPQDQNDRTHNSVTIKGKTFVLHILKAGTTIPSRADLDETTQRLLADLNVTATEYYVCGYVVDQGQEGGTRSND